MTEQLELALPYIQIEKLAIRETLRKREDIKRGSKESWLIPFNSIEIRENFNTRYEYDGIKELSDSMLSVGQLEEIYVDVLENGKIYVERGHRRHYAIKYNIDNKRVRVLPDKTIDDFSLVKCFINKSNMTELDRILNLFGTNMHSKELKPLEQAETAFRLKICMGEEISNEVIAEKLGVSRQTVDNLILIAKASDDVKNEIKVGALSFTNAVAFIRASKKKSKSTDEAEENSHKTTKNISQEQDNLKSELQELEALDQQAEDYNERKEALAKREQQLLEERANEVLVNKEALEEQIGKRLAANAILYYTEQILDDKTGELVPIEAFKIWSKQGTEINDLFIEEILKTSIQSVWIFKIVTIAESVITEPVAEREKSKYDEGRNEILQVQNIIKLSDRVSVRVEKLEISEGDKKDLTDWVKWMVKDLLELRDWIHSNKKQNKMR